MIRAICLTPERTQHCVPHMLYAADDHRNTEHQNAPLPSRNLTVHQTKLITRKEALRIEERKEGDNAQMEALSLFWSPIFM